jgi:hypothetical protein
MRRGLKTWQVGARFGLWLSGRAEGGSERRRGGKEDYFFLSLSFFLSFSVFSPFVPFYLGILIDCSFFFLSLSLFHPSTTILLYTTALFWILVLTLHHFINSFLITTFFFVFESTYISCPLLPTRKPS